jgi:hypothetical protein
MNLPFPRIVLCSVIGTAAFAAGCRAPEAQTPEAQAVVLFKDRVVEYAALREKLRGSAPDRPDEATPQEVDANQRGLGDLIKSARADAKPGDFFSPGMQTLVRKVLQDILARPGGDTVKASIMDENPGIPEILVNARYPSAVPLSTMPPEVLERLPELKEELEYRFIGPKLVLVDTEADIILDFTGDVLSR